MGRFLVYWPFYSFNVEEENTSQVLSSCTSCWQTYVDVCILLQCKWWSQNIGNWVKSIFCSTSSRTLSSHHMQEESSLHYSMAVTDVYFHLTSQTLLVLTTDCLKTGAKEQVHLTHSIHVLIFIAAGEAVIYSLVFQYWSWLICLNIRCKASLQNSQVGVYW